MSGASSFPASDVAAAVKMRLGVASTPGPIGGLCSVCGTVRDECGHRDLSCSHGGGTTSRHNAVRGAIYRFALRARLELILERVAFLVELGILPDVRRSADVRIEQAIATPKASGAPLEASMFLVLDIKVISTFGRGHAQAAAEDSRAPFERYHDVRSVASSAPRSIWLGKEG